MSKAYNGFGMFDLNINKFLETLRQTNALKIRVESAIDEADRGSLITGDIRSRLASDFTDLSSACFVVHSILASKSATRMANRLEDVDEAVTIQNAYDALVDIQSRMTDECEDIAVLVLSRDQRSLFHSTADQISGWPISSAFPDAARELEEASRCFALGRATASVFHGMRMLEIGIKAFSSKLNIPDPVKPAERNWGRILSVMKAKIDEDFPKNQRMPGSLGASYEALHTSLDAVKNPWRNATMHVEAFYQDAEARHILNNVIEFLKLLNQVLVEPELDLAPAQK